MPNLVEIIISGKNMAGPAINEAKGQAEGLGGAFTTAAVVAGAGAALLIAHATQMASSFQSDMEMLHTQAGVPQAAIGALSQQVLSLAGTVGFSPNSLADALFHVESSFASMPAQLNAAGGAMNILRVAANGAAIGHSNLTDTTNALDAAVAAGIPGVQNMDQAMGALNATVGSGDMKMQDLADAFGTGMVAVVKGYGLSIQDVGAALAVFGDNNIRGAQAGTNLRMAVQALAVPAHAGAAELKNLGMSTDQMAKDMQSGGLMKALEDFKTRMDEAGISANQEGQVITTVFGKKAGTGVALLVEQLDRLKSKYPEIQASMNNFSQDVSANNDTLSQKTKDVKAAFDALMIELGNLLLPVVTQVMDAFRQFASFLVDHQTAAKALAVVLGGILAIAIIAITVALWNMAAATIAATWPFLLVVGVIALVVTAIVQIIRHFSDFEHAGQAAVNAVAGAFQSAGDWIEGRWNALMNWLSGLGAGIANIGATIWNGLTSGLTDAVNWIIDQINGLIHGINNITGAVGIPGIPDIPHLAAGGPAGGLAQINEQGSELVRLPNGSTVIPHANSEQMLANSASSQPMILEIHSSGSAVDDMLLEILRKAVRVKGGGNVQLALGRN
jgi:TP901 family phage tail tape measure protein